MAIGLQVQCGCSSGGMAQVICASAKGQWVTANDDARTAQSAADLLSPAAIDDSVFHWVEVRDGVTRCLVRARMPVAGTITADIVARLYGVYTPPSSIGAYANDGTVKFLRLDNADAAAAGFTLDLVSSGTGLIQDSNYAYTDVLPDMNGYDLRGAYYIGVAIETACTYGAGAAATPVELLFLN